MLSSTRISVVLLACALLLTGCAAGVGEAASPSVTPSAAEDQTGTDKSDALPGWTPDLLLVRSFADDDGTMRTCEIRQQAVEDPATASSDVSARLSAAHAFLRDGDWSTTGVSIDDISPEDLANKRARGWGDAEVLMSILSDRIVDEFRAAGFLGEGVSFQVYNHCLAN